VPVTSAFFDDLSGRIERVVGYNEPTYIVGNLNVHLARDNNSNARHLTDLLSAFGFVVRNAQLTPVLGGLLDVVGTRRDLCYVLSGSALGAVTSVQAPNL
jgi:hypothetical protein